MNEILLDVLFWVIGGLGTIMLIGGGVCILILVILDLLYGILPLFQICVSNFFNQ